MNNSELKAEYLSTHKPTQCPALPCLGYSQDPLIQACVTASTYSGFPAKMRFFKSNREDWKAAFNQGYEQ